MFTENHEMPIGWPLGLGNMNMRLGVVENSQASAAEDSYSAHMPSTSFSSFSSSNLDTESTASFFQDHSVPLGRLIGIRSGDRGALNFPNTSRFAGHENISVRGSHLDVPRRRGAEISLGLCIPLLFGIIEKLSRSKSSSRR
ncbi:uncharacterized protein LOC132316141 isoform X1 [Cornus florida]|uniref:uncharacterized protein LOC132316141 isoform X1 n=1 Tax=Cornus florida TaxID=4283 RepID=UPI00289A8569|nr:uncharacterized protein LOC132316141 isoform X1 [Cornus florida]